MTQVELTKRTGLTIKTINDIIKGKAPITSETALKLESVFGMPARFWNNLEVNYQEIRARQQAEPDIEKDTQTAALIPYAELARNGFVKLTKEPREKVIYLRQFFGVASLAYIPDILPAAFSKPTRDSSPNYALAAWIRIGELMAGEIETQPFNDKILKKKLPEFRALTMQEDGADSPQLEDLCASCGVALVVVPHLPKTNAHGVTHWLQPGKAMIQLSTKYKYADEFWLSFFHELGHISLHSKRDTFVETGGKNKEEAEADYFASECLIPGSKYRAFVTKNKFSQDTIAKFAHKIGVDPGIVIGRLHQEHILDWNDFQDLRREIIGGLV